MLKLGSGSSSPGLGMGDPSGMLPQHGLHSGFVPVLVSAFGVVSGVKPQLYADNFKCVSSDDEVLLEAVGFTNSCIQLVGQAPAPS